MKTVYQISVAFRVRFHVRLSEREFHSSTPFHLRVKPGQLTMHTVKSDRLLGSPSSQALAQEVHGPQPVGKLVLTGHRQGRHFSVSSLVTLVRAARSLRGRDSFVDVPHVPIHENG